ncbi:hypothetical protein AB4Z21_13695 [Paenibacillus sp. MCAF20]
MIKKLLFAFALTALLIGCAANGGNLNSNENEPTTSPTTSPAVSETEAPPPTTYATTHEAADAVVQALKDKDLTMLASLVHPVKGLLFSPYAHIDQASALTFQADALPALTDATIHTWGAYDGSGEPIALTFAQYYDKFVYDKPFIEAETVGEDEIIGHGNTLVNIKDVFPDSYTVDYHFSGFDAQYEGMDWESLILVLEQYEGAWYVSAIVHSQWTI